MAFLHPNPRAIIVSREQFLLTQKILRDARWIFMKQMRSPGVWHPILGFVVLYLGGIVVSYAIVIQLRHSLGRGGMVVGEW